MGGEFGSGWDLIFALSPFKAVILSFPRQNGAQKMMAKWSALSGAEKNRAKRRTEGSALSGAEKKKAK